MDVTLLQLFDLKHTRAEPYFRQFTYPWEALEGLGEYLVRLGRTLGEEFIEREPGVFVHRSATVSSGAELHPPCIICAGTQVRCGAYVRGNVLVGENCVVGNSTELKNSVLFDGVQVPHFNYAGDSILGYRAHLGAGAICSNVRLDRGEVIVRGDAPYPTGRIKVGAFVGDFAEVGCNSVLAPGAVLGRCCRVFPLTFVRGAIESPAGTI